MHTFTIAFNLVRRHPDGRAGALERRRLAAAPEGYQASTAVGAATALAGMAAASLALVMTTSQHRVARRVRAIWCAGIASDASGETSARMPRSVLEGRMGALAFVSELQAEGFPAVDHEPLFASALNAEPQGRQAKRKAKRRQKIQKRRGDKGEMMVEEPPEDEEDDKLPIPENKRPWELTPGFNPAVQLGAMEPLGFWDPLGFANKDDEFNFLQLRRSEIKHGRVAMLASLGFVAQHFIRFPGFEECPPGLGAVFAPPSQYGFAALVVIVGLIDALIFDEIPGDYGDPAGLNMYTDEMRNKELNNGRMAMVTTLGIIIAELYTGYDAVNQLNPANWPNPFAK